MIIHKFRENSTGDDTFPSSQLASWRMGAPILGMAGDAIQNSNQRIMSRRNIYIYIYKIWNSCLSWSHKKDKVIESYFSGWWFQTFVIYHFNPFHIWDVIRNPLTNSIIFKDGHIAPPTSYCLHHKKMIHWIGWKIYRKPWSKPHQTNVATPVNVPSNILTTNPMIHVPTLLRMRFQHPELKNRGSAARIPRICTDAKLNSEFSYAASALLGFLGRFQAAKNHWFNKTVQGGSYNVVPRQLCYVGF